jgi:diketogulonate reductase-like aldo/keto reductase
MATKNNIGINSGAQVNRKNSMTEMPQICLGTVLNLSKNITMEYILIKFKEAIDYGYNHIDSASLYRNMQIMPEVIEHGIQKYGRDGFWITWKYESIDEDKIKYNIEELGCDYFDLVLLHFPSNLKLNKLKMDILIKLKNAGLIKHIGVSNYENPDDLIELNEYLKTKNCCIYANQIQARPIGSNANVIKGRTNPDYNRLLDVCSTNNIRLMFYSPYSSLWNRMFSNNEKNNQDAEIINEILTNPDFGKKVISYYTRQYLVDTRNVLINGVTTGKSFIQNYHIIKSILDKTHINQNITKTQINNNNIFKKITKLKLSGM